MDLSELLTVRHAVYALLMAGLILGFIRLVLGPDLPDRVVALDMIAVTTVAFIISYTIFTGETAFLDAAIVVALVGFLGTVAFARYLERRVSHD